MNYTLHKLPEGFIITSDVEIKQGNTCLNIYNKVPSIMKNVNVGGKDWEENKKGFLKVIAQQDQIDLSSLSEEEQKKIGWFDVSIIPTKYCIEHKHYISEDDKKCYDTGYLDGFQKAQELLSDKRFTLKDMKKCFQAGEMYCATEGKVYPRSNDFQQTINILSQPKSWEIDGLWENNKFKITNIL
jgi:hypothetical protein